jgi:hypothetical protein
MKQQKQNSGTNLLFTIQILQYTFIQTHTFIRWRLTVGDKGITVNYVPQTKFGGHIVFAPFLIIIIIMAPKRSLWDILFLLCFLLLLLLLLLLLHHPDCCRVMYCYSTFLFHYYSYYSYSSTHFCPLDFSEMPWSNFMKPCRNIICHVKLCL